MPAPLGPMTASSSPGAAAKATSRSASRSPKLLLSAAGLDRRRGGGRWRLHPREHTLLDVRVLFFGDVVGGPGRRGLAAALPALRDEHAPDLVIANGENSAGGVGITERTANDLFGSGVDLITTGNHVYRQRDAYEYLDREERLVRPANYPKGNPGRGSLVARGRRGASVGLLNLSGALQLTVARSPFPAADAELAELERRGAEVVIVDFHAEVTSEKIAMGWHLDGRVAAVLGTHTHVPTADAQGAAGRDGVRLRRRHDRLAAERARGRGRGRARPLRDRDADPLPDRGGGRLDQRRRLRRGRRRPGYIGHAGDPAGSLSSTAIHGGFSN